MSDPLDRQPIEIHRISRDDIVWPYTQGAPYVEAFYRMDVDPMPAYPHDADLVLATALYVAEFFRPLTPLILHVSEFECVSRTNGCMMHRQEYDDEGNRWVMTGADIWLSGKRIPPHPAVTRYVVAHEFGHAVEDWISLRDGLDAGQLDAEYAELRGIDNHSGAFAGRWHDSSQEVFACDFRMMAGIEIDYWPHAGVERPGPEIVRWWREKLFPPKTPSDATV